MKDGKQRKTKGSKTWNIKQKYRHQKGNDKNKKVFKNFVKER